MLGFATLRAPFDGVVTARHVDPGHLVRVAASEPLLVISRIDPVRVVVQVPETDALLVRPGSRRGPARTVAARYELQRTSVTHQ